MVAFIFALSVVTAQVPPRDTVPPQVAAARMEAELKDKIATQGLTATTAVHLAQLQEQRGDAAAAELTLLDARKLFPSDAAVAAALARFYTSQAAMLRSTTMNVESGRQPCGVSTAPLSSAPVRVGGNIKAPTKIKDVRPVYPDEARAARVQGVVILEIAVESDGRVAQACVLRSIPLLDAAAVDAVKQWEFTPTLLNGAPVPVIMTVTVNFTLQ